MDINGLASYSDYIASSQDAGTTKASQTVSSVSKDSTDEELLGACKQFEAYFLEQVFKEMKKTVPKNEDADAPTSNLVDYFKDSALQQLTSDSTEKNGLGLAEQLYEQMKRNYGL
ncbi:MAG: rod-binding protein [Lachnospiraceae bacterium]|nr:rod-binding protein [Lachnospiraceae bacterium]